MQLPPLRPARPHLVATFSLRDLPNSFYDDPFPTYRALRGLDPIHRMGDGSLFLTRHRDLEEIYKDPGRFRSDKKVEFAPKYGEGSLLFQHHTTSLVFNDPPLHTRVRRLISGALIARAIAGMEPALVALVDRLLDAMAGRGAVDLIEDFASAIPDRGDRQPARRPACRPRTAARLVARHSRRAGTGADARAAAPGERAVADFWSICGNWWRSAAAIRGSRARRADAADPGRGHGERLTENELLQNCIFLLNAGHETTTNLIGNGLNSCCAIRSSAAA